MIFTTTLGSMYHPANEASVAWHQRFGFVEEPDFMLAQSHYYFALYGLNRREALGDLSPVEQEVLENECREWKARWKELQAVLNKEGIEAENGRSNLGDVIRRGRSRVSRGRLGRLCTRLSH